ncbi:unnamed protein product [Musa acuminata subsp. malaccensis]|uniref:(wild Malaysian banana) hypothetical protein n=1 Tax=Musa acuminata subsp. malaccensis TaxID=214687 RepID=A0A804IZL4_MUSAM|nr:PREDICTED: uncharacterized protein LOC103983628 [Musa acuminata subsp. malaccensis]CAG1837176.1 unnamed protein product [Musa acuminata subsp. malaccensis]
MGGYSRMGVVTGSTAKSRSMEFSDPTFFSPPPKEAPEEPQQKEAADVIKPVDHFSWLQQQQEEEEEEEEGGQRFGVILSRTCSSASQRFSNGSTGLQSAVMRAFSMRRSSSVREGYWRIHDTGDEDGGADLLEEEQQMRYSRKKKKKNKGKFLRACKRLLGF